MFTTVNTAEKALFDMTNDEIVHAHATAIYNMENSMREDGFESVTFAQWQRNVKMTRAMILELTQNIPQTDTEDVLDNFYHNVGRFAMSPNNKVLQSTVQDNMSFLVENM